MTGAVSRLQFVAERESARPCSRTYSTSRHSRPVRRRCGKGGHNHMLLWRRPRRLPPDNQLEVETLVSALRGEAPVAFGTRGRVASRWSRPASAMAAGPVDQPATVGVAANSLVDRLRAPPDRASGTQLIQELIAAGCSRATRFSPAGDKVMRVHAQTATIENGFVWLPHEAPWLADYLAEFAAFPRGRWDDQSTPPPRRWRGRTGGSLFQGRSSGLSFCAGNGGDSSRRGDDGASATGQAQTLGALGRMSQKGGHRASGVARESLVSARSRP